MDFKRHINEAQHAGWASLADPSVKADRERVDPPQAGPSGPLLHSTGGPLHLCEGFYRPLDCWQAGVLPDAVDVLCSAFDRGDAGLTLGDGGRSLGLSGGAPPPVVVNG